MRRRLQELVGQGYTPLRAAELAGYKNPVREIKRGVEYVAQAQGADPLEVLRRIAQFGTPSDRVSACAKLLAQPQQQITAPDRAFVLVVRGAA